MEPTTSSSDPGTVKRLDWIRVTAATASACLLVALGAVLLVQVQVTDGGFGATRTCGSVFDSAVDRSGWELWWARDLDEPDEAIRSALVRTSRCPDAVNERVTVAAALGGAGVVLGAVAITRHRGRRSDGTHAGTVGVRVERLGRVASYVGAALTALGIIAIVVLVADADSTLFLYTDRLVVGVVGLIVLVPTISLFVIGRVLVLLGSMSSTSMRTDEDRGQTQ